MKKPFSMSAYPSKAYAHLIEKAEINMRKWRTRLEMALAHREKLEAMKKP